MDIHGHRQVVDPACRRRTPPGSVVWRRSIRQFRVRDAQSRSRPGTVVAFRGGRCHASEVADRKTCCAQTISAICIAALVMIMLCAMMTMVASPGTMVNDLIAMTIVHRLGACIPGADEDFVRNGQCQHTHRMLHQQQQNQQSCNRLGNCELHWSRLIRQNNGRHSTNDRKNMPIRIYSDQTQVQSSLPPGLLRPNRLPASQRV